ncbi:MAG TPA: DNA ligase D [Candidatus Sulfotelmatobacter sp.]|nr:DNA ligase D [Candidatus Sulfotelmatobacter sp.]
MPHRTTSPTGTSASMPDFVPPMLATGGSRAFSDPGWIFELKWDGYRVEAVVREGRARIWTRNRLDAARYFPDLAGPAPWLDAREAIVDGEVVALDDQGRPNFSLLQDRTGVRGPGAARDPDGPRPMADARAAIPLAYEVFDLLWLDGRSLLDTPLVERKARLRERLRDDPLVHFAAHVETDGEAFFEAIREQGLEGLMAKRRESRYEPGRRSHDWLKLKARKEQELVIGGWEPGLGSHAELGAVLVGVYHDGELRYAGEVGSGMDARTRAGLLKRMRAAERPDPPFAKPPRLRDVHWTEPTIVIRAEFTDWTSDDLVRQSTFKGLDPTKDPRDVVREPLPGEGPTPPRARAVTKPARHSGPTKATPPDQRKQAVTPAELAALDTMGKAGTWSVGGRTVSLTNLDKPLFPEVGLTKRDLVRYYVTVAPVLLPHLRDRGLTLDRWPDGPAGPHFWHKEIPTYAPDWVGRWHYQSSEPDQSHTYIVADEVATLAFLANQAAIDLHPWTSRTGSPHRPTYALIDIDPGPRTTFDAVLVIARLYRTALQHLGVRAYPKVTGKRGLQIWVPVEPRYEFRETAAWVEGLSRAVGAIVPELVSWQWSVKERGGLIRLDYTQNASNKTLVAPYAVRPLATAPVSAPITWDELGEPGLRPDGWTIATMPDRIRQVGDLFAGALTYDQVLPSL